MHTNRLEGSETGAQQGVRDRLVASAVEVWSQRGYHATSVQDIVSGAGLTKGSFYYYFTSKDDCLRDIHRDFIDGELTRLEEATAGITDPVVAIQQIIRTFLYGVREWSAYVRIFDQEWRHVESEGSEEIRQKRDRIVQIVTEHIAAGMRQGIFKEHANPRLGALAIIGMCGWSHRWYQPDGPLPSTAIADAWSTMIIDGLRNGEPAPAAGETGKPARKRS